MITPYFSSDLYTEVWKSIRRYSIENFWKLETVRLNDLPDLTDDGAALEQFNNSICFENGRYYVRWPWKIFAWTYLKI